MRHALADERVAVIGGTGFIGSHLVECLLELGASVSVFARGTHPIENLARVSGRCHFCPIDIVPDRQALCAAIGQVNPRVVFHLASAPDAAESFSQMVNCAHQNVIGTVQVLEAASLAGTEVVVYADSSKDYGNGPVPYRSTQRDAPVCSYAISNTAAWNFCRLASSMTGMAVCGLRPTFVYGPRQNWNLIAYVAACVRENRPVRLQGGTQTRDLLYVEDAVRAFVAAAIEKKAWGKVTPIGGGREVKIHRICKEALKVLGSDLPIVAEAEKPRLTEVWRSYCDNAEARKLLRWSPVVGLSQGLERTLAQPKQVPVPVEQTLADGFAGIIR
jgi:dTDP-glucose 4,6-dehydratase